MSRSQLNFKVAYETNSETDGRTERWAPKLSMVRLDMQICSKIILYVKRFHNSGFQDKPQFNVMVYTDKIKLYLVYVNITSF